MKLPDSFPGLICSSFRWNTRRFSTVTGWEPGLLTRSIASSPRPGAASGNFRSSSCLPEPDEPDAMNVHQSSGRCGGASGPVARRRQVVVARFSPGHQRVGWTRDARGLSRVAGPRFGCRERSGLNFLLPACVCVPLAQHLGSGSCVCRGGGPEAPSAGLSFSRMHLNASSLVALRACSCGTGSKARALASGQDLSWRSPGGVRSMARVNSRNAVRRPASNWRFSASAPTRWKRTSVRRAQSSQTRGGARRLQGGDKQAREVRD